MKRVNILSVCGSGTVTSSMVAGKLKEYLSDKGYHVETVEARPTEAMNLAQSGKFDLLTFTSPLPQGDYEIPVINAFACLTGIGEDEFLDEVTKVVEGLKK
ncbi:PTS sugar transporter subunit IIB [Propionispira raffinosivorans]|jgi:PTS system galactitol-specific IIB component|uniref:PTS sugar transporter subunit IIB n=1 Tax=Propionispira raffinosivorans TaxID=86959 RepID=UPI00037645CC|nr:PTS sugar transporter subunit IIB [Propionispira raffinosivorans]